MPDYQLIINTFLKKYQKNYFFRIIKSLSTVVFVYLPHKIPTPVCLFYSFLDGAAENTPTIER